MSGTGRQQAAAAGGRLRAETGDEAARLFDEVQRTTTRADTALSAARQAEAAGDLAAAAAARRQAVALVDDLQHLCARLRKAQSGVAEALLLSSKLSCALVAYRQPNPKGL